MSVEVLERAPTGHDAIELGLAGDDQRGRRDAAAVRGDVRRAATRGPSGHVRLATRGDRIDAAAMLGQEPDAAGPSRSSAREISGRQAAHAARTAKIGNARRGQLQVALAAGLSPHRQSRRRRGDEHERRHAVRPPRRVVARRSGRRTTRRRSRPAVRRARSSSTIDRPRPTRRRRGPAPVAASTSSSEKLSTRWSRAQRVDRRRHPLPAALNAGNQHDRRALCLVSIISVPQRLSCLERIADPLERLALAAQAQERLALEVEQIRLRSRSSRCGRSPPARTRASVRPTSAS